MTAGTPFHERTAPLNRKQSWREWSGYLAASAYDHLHIHEYSGIRHAAVLIDVSPLYKYIVRGPDAARLIDRVITRDATKIQPGQVIYTPWCDDHGKVIDDGTVARLGDDSYRWTSAEQHLRWFELNARGLDIEIDDVSETTAAIALQGPLARDVLGAATDADWSDLGYYRRRAGHAGKIQIDVSRTGYTGDLGYELWVKAEQATDLWDRLMEAGRPFALRPAGMLALDMARLEAGLILIEVDYTSATQALIPSQNYSPFEIGLGRLVNLNKESDFVGRRALLAEQAVGGPMRRLVGLEIDWPSIEENFEQQGLPIHVPTAAWREQVPVYVGGRQVGRATSGTWSPTLKKHIALAQVDAAHEAVGSRLSIEQTVEGHRGRATATVAPLPFFDPPRKRL
ncbi:MAG TPA: aminomethyltransferase family protein [Candidatus Limnocylindrales bacterium]|nr:aminomethyltransferase family protein [Candidatus Limnocylindrales bacterium]